MKEFENLVLANGIKLDANGYLTKESLRVASHVTIPHEALNTIEDRRREGNTSTAANQQRYVFLCRASRMQLHQMSKNLDGDKERLDITLSQ